MTGVEARKPLVTSGKAASEQCWEQTPNIHELRREWELEKWRLLGLTVLRHVHSKGSLRQGKHGSRGGGVPQGREPGWHRKTGPGKTWTWLPGCWEPPSMFPN